MKIFCGVLLFFSASFVFGEGKFLKTDSILKESARLRQRACDEKSAWSAEKSRIQDFADMVDKRAEFLGKKAVAMAAENSLREKKEADIADKVSRDKVALDSIEAFLSSFYVKVLERASSFECSKNLPNSEEFAMKTVPEKLRVVSTALRSMYGEDLAIIEDKSILSTGVVVKAEGHKSFSPVSEFKVRENGKK